MPPPPPWPATLLSPPAMAARSATPLATLGLSLRACIWLPAPCLLGCLRRACVCTYFSVTGACRSCWRPTRDETWAEQRAERDRAALHSEHPLRTWRWGRPGARSCRDQAKAEPERLLRREGTKRWPRSLEKWVRLRLPLLGLRQTTEGRGLHAGCAVRKPCSSVGSATTRPT